MKPDLSIVIVNWNTLQMLRECLDSVFSGFGNLQAEVIVVDNGSDDGSPGMVESEFPQALLIRNRENRGFAAANNQGFEVSTGKYILLLNSDTIVLEDVLSNSVEYLENNSEIGAMGCRVLNKDQTMQPTCMQFPTLTNLALRATALEKLPWPPFFDKFEMRRWQRTEIREVDSVSGCYLLVRASIIDEIGPLDEGFFFLGEEVDWCKRMRNAGWRLHFAPVGEIIHYGGASSGGLKYKKDILLTECIVRLHKKHCGLASAIAAWTILLAFNVTRSVLWTLRALVSSNPTARYRRDCFVGVVARFGQTWPKGVEYLK